MSKGQDAERILLDNPERRDSSIAKELGMSGTAVRKARKRLANGSAHTFTKKDRKRDGNVDVEVGSKYWDDFRQLAIDHRITHTALASGLIKYVVDNNDLIDKLELGSEEKPAPAPVAKITRERSTAPVEYRPSVRNPHSLDPTTFTGTNEEWQRLVDPEFTGTPMEFTALYGHTQILTAEGYANMRYGNLASKMNSLVRKAQELADDRKIDLNWLRSPDPKDTAKLRAALEWLRPLLAEAEAALARATD